MIKLKHILLEVYSGLSKIPQPGKSSGKPIKWRSGAKIQTKYLTIDQILDGKIKGIPYYKDVINDYDKKNYSWEVMEKVMEYAKNWIAHPDSLKNLPPIIVVDNTLQDGAHRIAAVYLIQQRLKPNDNFWKNVKLKVEFGNFSDVDYESVDLKTIVSFFVKSEVGQKNKDNDCKTVTRAFVNWAKQYNIPNVDVILLAPPSKEFVKKNPEFKGKSGLGDSHIMPVINDVAIDFTVRQFGLPNKFDNPLITPLDKLKSIYRKFGYYTDAPKWMNGKSDWRGKWDSIPFSWFDKNFSDEKLNESSVPQPGKFFGKPIKWRSDIDKTIQENKLPKILIPRRGGVERRKNYLIAIQRKIQNYIKNGMVGDLDLSETTITELPSNLTKVGGVLDLGSSMVRKLPDNLKLIDNTLFLNLSEIESLPDNLTINGNLDLHSTDYLKKLPVNLTVDGDVLMSYADAKQLSDNTKIGGTLDLSGTEIKQLPKNLYVGGDLDLTESEIEVLPKDLSVGGDLYVMNTPVGREYTENQLKRMLPNVKGDIYTTKIENIDI